MLVSENFGWVSNMVSESDSVGLKKWDISIRNFSILYRWHLIWEYNISLFFILSPHYLQFSQAGFSSHSFLKCNLELTLSFIILWSMPVHFSLVKISSDLGSAAACSRACSYPTSNAENSPNSSANLCPNNVRVPITQILVVVFEKPSIINFWLNSFSRGLQKLCPFLGLWLAISANVLQISIKLKYQKRLRFHEAIPHRQLNQKVPKGHCTGIKFAERLSRGSSDGIFFLNGFCCILCGSERYFHFLIYES